jgi:hypothetical protein
MADGDKSVGPQVACGEVATTGSAISIDCGFRPAVVLLHNRTGEATLAWNKRMPDAAGYKVNGVASGTFTGTAPTSDLNLATPAFSGTGLSAVGQVITTTDNQTMTLNQCAGMWLISATGATPPNLILSNTAVSAAPAVLTVQGSANTDAGAYKIVKGVTPAGSFTGGAADSAFITTLGITPTKNGFTVGTDSDINPGGSEVLYWSAWKF